MSSLTNLLVTLNNVQEEILRNALFVSFLAVPAGLQGKLGYTLAHGLLVTSLGATPFVGP